MLVPLRRQTYVYPVPVVAFNTTLPPLQMLVEPAAVIVAVGGAPTVTFTAEEVAEQLPLVMVTV